MSEQGRIRPYEGIEVPEGQQMGGVFVPYGDGWEIPAEAEYNNEGQGGGPFRWRIWYRVIDGVPQCVGLVCVPYEGEFISAAALRSMPLGRLIEDAVTWAGRPADDSVIRRENITLEEARELKRAVTQHHRKVKQAPRGGKAPSDDDLRRVADIYRENLGTRKPTQAVADAFPLSRSTAGRWVMQARKRGLLGPAVFRRPGERKEGTDG